MREAIARRLADYGSGSRPRYDPHPTCSCRSATPSTTKRVTTSSPSIAVLPSGRRGTMSDARCTNVPCNDKGCPTHGDPIWEATVHGELDDPEPEVWFDE